MLCCAGAVHALDVAVMDIRDDAALRASLLTDWFQDAPARVLRKPPVVRELPSGQRVQVRVEAGRGEFLIVLARQRNDAYPSWSQGSWVLYRNQADGRATRIRVFPRSDPYVYLQFQPDGAGRSRMDLVAYDGFLLRDFPLPISFERLMTLPLNQVLEAASPTLVREYLDPDVPAYADLRALVAGIRRRLPDLSYQDDGAWDENGIPVYIATLAPQPETAGLNCSGFAKWVVDGILRPRSGARLPIAPLKLPVDQRGSSFSIAFEDRLDPFFGLDWTRNLAIQAAVGLGSASAKDAAALLAELEVRDNPVSAVLIRDSGTTRTKLLPGYLEDSGFALEGLLPLLYVQALRQPRRFYLASVNDEQGTSPRLRRHFHVAVLVPHFTEAGVFTVSVFESAAETPYQVFARNNRGRHVNLVQLGVSGAFDP